MNEDSVRLDEEWYTTAGDSDALRRRIRASRTVHLPSGLTSPAAVRALLLESVTRAESSAADDRERNDAADWRRRVESATDGWLWADYCERWPTAVSHRRPEWPTRSEIHRLEDFGPGWEMAIGKLAFIDPV